MENKETMNENFTLSEEQIRFIDYEFINKKNKKKELNSAVTKLVRRNDNNFQKKDVEQIMELYLKIKKQKANQRNEWTREQEEKLTEALKKEFEEKGEDINIADLANKLEGTGLFGPHDKRSIANKLHKLVNESKEYRQLKPKKIETIGLKKN